MPKHSRKLLLLVALCWVAPLSAQQRPVAAHKHPACPHSQANSAIAATDGTPGGGSIYVERTRALGLLP